MTEQFSVLSSLKSIFPESSWSWAISSLKHDPLIWEAISDQEFFLKISNHSKEPKGWTPDKLALIALDQEDFASIPEALESEAQSALIQLLERGSLVDQQGNDFYHAALLGLAIYRCHSADDWAKINESLRASTQVNRAWFTPLAILFALVPDRPALIKQLISQAQGVNISPLIVHAVLSQPVPPADTQGLLWDVISGLPLVRSAALLSSLSQDRPEMTMRLANEWLQAHPPSPAPTNYSNLGDQVQQLMDNLLSAQILTFAGQLNEAEQLKIRSLGDLNALQIDVSNQLVGESLRDKNLEYALSQWTRTSRAPKLTPPAGLVVELLKAGRIEDSLTLLPDTDGNTQTPLRWMNNIYQALENEDVPQARLFAHQALKSFVEIYEEDPGSAARKFGSRRDMIKFLTELTHQLADLALYKESFRAAQIASNINPDDPQVLLSLVKSARAAGDHHTAIGAAQFAVALEPTQPEFRRQLSLSLEAAGNWSAALPERQAVLEHRFAQSSSKSWPTSPDLLAYANCAIQAGEPGEAYEVCQKAIDLDPADGHAHAVLGEALSALGDDQQAMEHFNLATQLSPHQASSWLSLARAYQRSSQTAKAVETLRTASHAVPDDPDIFFSLGKIHIDDDAPSQAQSALERAYQLVSQPQKSRSQAKSNQNSSSQAETFARNREQLCQIALAFGDILVQLGHQERANQVYEDAYQAYPAYPGLAYIYAKSILEKGDLSAALAPLAIAVSANPGQPQPYMDYARTLLEVGETPQDAVQALQKALKLLKKQYHEGDPQAEQIRNLATALLAQAQEASGELLPALHNYTQALETPLAKDEQWKSRLSIGLGRVAIQLEQPEVAIAALQDPNQKEIQHPEVAQILCDAYTAINLTQEALFAARSAVHLAPDDVPILAWFAGKAVELGVVAEAVPALTSAAQLDPKRTDLIIRLAEVQVKMGKEKAAREAYLSALSSPYSTPDNLYQAADGLSDLGDTESAAECLERALELQPHPPLELIFDLSSAYRTTGKHELAIRTLDKGIEQDAENALLHAYKAELLVELGRHQAARSCLEHALILDPNNPEVHLQIASILREQDDPHLAFEHALVAVRNHPDPLAAAGMAIELARSTLHEEQVSALLDSARAIARDAPPGEKGAFSRISHLEYYCTSAEIALELEEQIAAATDLNQAVLLASEHPRVLALQSRMALRQGDREAAWNAIAGVLEQLDRAIQEEEPPAFSTNTLLGISMAALDLLDWERAAGILDIAISHSTHDSYLRLQKARMLVLQAEFQRMCQALEIIKHAPGGAALSPRTYRILEERIQDTVVTLSKDMQADLPPAVRRWQKRAEVAFHPSVDEVTSIDDLPRMPSDQAALITSSAQYGDAAIVSRLFHAINSQAGSDTLHHTIFASYALALGTIAQDQISLEQAAEAIKEAVEQNPTNAIYHVIQARVAEQLGDWHIALKAMQTAISLWSGESRWQAYFAHLLMLNDQYPEAVLHYLSAIEMEPDYLQHYIDLSYAYRQNGEPGEATAILEQAVKKAPEQSKSYLALAEAYYEQQNYVQAKRNADLAVKIAPNNLQPLLISARIATKLGDPAQALRNVEAALHLNPDDPDTLYLQAQAFSEMGRFDQALQVIEKAIPLSANPLALYLLRADLFASADESQKLLPELISLAEQYPDEPQVLAPLAIAYANEGQDSQAIQAAQQALQRNSGELPLDEQAHLHYLLGRLLRKSGQLDQSIHQLSEAIRITPQSLDSYLELGLTQEERRQYEPALETYKKAIKIYPSDPKPYYQAGLLLKSSRDYPGAEMMLRKAAERAPDNVDIHRQLAALVALNLVHNRQPVSTEI